MKRVAAADRRSQRQALQRQKQLQRQRAHSIKMQEQERAAYEVQVFENRLDMLTSVHQDCAEPCDWRTIAQEAPPQRPIRFDTNEQNAQSMLGNYRPNFFAKLFGQEAKQRSQLQEQVQLAHQEDESQYQEALQVHKQEEEDWRKERDLATRVLQREWQAYLDVVAEARPFVDVEELGSRITLSTGKNGEVVVSLRVNSDEVIPSEVKSLLKSGKLSTKKMPQGRFNELYQDYVCGCVFRVSRELFALLPVEMVVVHCFSYVPDSSTGYVRKDCLLSAAIPCTQAARLNFDSLDPSDALQNFVHNMHFKKTQGFASVALLKSGDY